MQQALPSGLPSFILAHHSTCVLQLSLPQLISIPQLHLSAILPHPKPQPIHFPSPSFLRKLPGASQSKGKSPSSLPNEERSSLDASQIRLNRILVVQIHTTGLSDAASNTTAVVTMEVGIRFTLYIYIDFVKSGCCG